MLAHFLLGKSAMNMNASLDSWMMEMCDAEYHNTVGLARKVANEKAPVAKVGQETYEMAYIAAFQGAVYAYAMEQK